MRKCPKCGRQFSSNERVCPDDASVLEDTVSFEEQAIGRTLDGKYRIDGYLKRGGMGAVYRGTHVLLNKPIAIKLIRPELVTSQDVVSRFFREARAAAQLSHPNIVTVHDLGQAKDDGTLYIIMEIVDGKSLKEVIQSGGPWEPKRALRFIKGVVSALSLAHRKGIVHRDLKPQNIMVCRDSEGREIPKLLDFGIAKTLEPDSPALTATGMVLGTPHYMSSEQAKGLPADQRSDIYALGIILYEMLVGKVPFDDKSIPSILVKHLTEPPRPPSAIRGDIPAGVETLILKCLEKDPEKRVQSADELGRALSDLVETGTHPAEPTVAMEPTLADPSTVERERQVTMAGAAAAVPPPVPFPKAPAAPAKEDPTRHMDSGTVRAGREAVRPPAVPARGSAAPGPPPLVRTDSGSRTGVVMAILSGLLVLMAIAATLFLLMRNRSRATETPVATASSELPSMEAKAAEPPVETNATDPDAEPSATPPIATRNGSSETPPREPDEPAVATSRADPPPPKPTKPAQSETPTAHESTAPVGAPPEATRQPPPVAEEAIPDKPVVSIDCEGVRDACALLRVTLREALEKKGMRVALPARADVLVRIDAEELEARQEQQFGNTFVIRTYSVTLEAEAPRFGDSVSLPPRTFSFDARLGREKLRGETFVIANQAAERIERYWKTKRQER